MRKQEVTVLIDSRERKPLLFPKYMFYQRRLIVTRPDTRVMDAGDYSIEGSEPFCIIERKGSLQELRGNTMTRDRGRFVDSLRRLSDATAFPYLWLDGSLAEFTQRCPDSERVLDSLIGLCVRFGIRIMWPGRCETRAARTAAGALVVRLILHHAEPVSDPGEASHRDQDAESPEEPDKNNFPNA